ncbi:MAG: DAK2 domain-containing protein [Gracilibacteraceae bacterium]|jgi:DAK2 domain fusion protein YloV|nr:DAK2 domain-containing protein [Gracilibacteraceae bacterium]
MCRVSEYSSGKEVHILSTKNIDGIQLRNMIISGANNLENNKGTVNALNVFPVPDGDTGTNMSLTMQLAVKEIMAVRNIEVQSVAAAAANGSLMGARGNSGVILSQIWRGFAKALKNQKSMDVKVLANALMEGSNTAYKAIMKPTEGTILTVIRETAEYAVKVSENFENSVLFLEEIIEKANSVLGRTKEMLQVLKNAGVVDAGGKGLIYIFEGMYHLLKTGEIIQLKAVTESEAEERPVFREEKIEFGYCTEFFIKGRELRPEKFREEIMPMGDSLLVVGDEKLLKVHIHTNNPGGVLELAITHGELSKIKIDNMREQHNELLFRDGNKSSEAAEEAPKPLEKYGTIAVAMGEGISDIFRDLGANEIIEGGQTMNPSTEDILNSVNKINAETVYIFPNNSNIILAANQAKSMADKNVIVAATKSIPQGISALMALNHDKSIEENNMKIDKAIASVKSGLVTYAVRNSSYDGIDIEEGNVLGMVEGKISGVGDDILEVSRKVLDEMIDGDSSLISIYYGSNVTEEEALKLKEEIEELYSDCEIELHFGGQPLYYYILSVE